ncbi:MAG: hypothetical protein KGI50_07565 [Patescibacteria group bacterium]|nr:hypothetical protein [Patescibacteria group bacterium]MDE2438965.1 hypothetical protein [Patescibacteria group bacterium]
MPTCSRVKWPAMDIEYGWMFEIRSCGELLDYWSTVHKILVEEGFQEVRKGVDQEHTRTPYGSILAFYQNLKGIGALDAIKLIDTTLQSSMLNAIKTEGTIFVHKNGSWFSPTEGIVVSESIKTEIWKLPDNNDIKITKWPGGNHYYAKVGSQEVVVNGIKKWNSEAMARMKAREFIKLHPNEFNKKRRESAGSLSEDRDARIKR